MDDRGRMPSKFTPVIWNAGLFSNNFKWLSYLARQISYWKEILSRSVEGQASRHDARYLYIDVQDNISIHSTLS